MSVREIAYDLLDSIYKNKSFSNIELNKALNENSLSNLDKGFLTRLVYGTIKEERMLDYELSKVNKLKDIKLGVKVLLRMSLYQLRLMDKVPDYAVINEAVEISKQKHGLLASKYVNGMLRSLTRETFIPKLDDFEDKFDYYSLIFGVPSWVCKMVAAHHGEKTAMDYITSFKEPSPITLRVNTLKTTYDDIISKPYFKKSSYSPYGVIYTGEKSLNKLKEFLDGKVMIQGESSQLVAPFLDPKPNENILDMCAAPGGKTYHIAALMNNTGHIYSYDLYEHRIKLLVMNLPRLGITNVTAKTYDSTKLSNIHKEKYFDRILLDAPCSGLGVARRKPDIFINLRPNDIDRLVKLQQELINQAYILLKNKGTFVYSTCTIDKKENEKQVEYILNKYNDMKLIEYKTILPNKEIVDGFFIAKFVKG